MPTSHVLIHIDGREVVLRRRGLTGGVALAAVGACVAHGDHLIREDEDGSRLVSAEDAIEVEGAAPAAFRVRRGELPPEVKVDGRLWDWGEPADLRLAGRS